MRTSSTFHPVRISACAMMAFAASAVIALAVAALAATPRLPRVGSADLPRNSVCHDAADTSPHRLRYSATAPLGWYFPSDAPRDLVQGMGCVTSVRR